MIDIINWVKPRNPNKGPSWKIEHHPTGHMMSLKDPQEAPRRKMDGKTQKVDGLSLF